MTDEIPKDHPRAQSLNIRHKIIDGMHRKIVAEAGLIAHGRGEAFDYLIGEQTHDFADEAIKAAAASLKLADHPILSLNGNVTVLCPAELVKLSNDGKIPMEINLFYKKPGRIEAIMEVLNAHGAKTVYGTDPAHSTSIDEISSNRRIVDQRGIARADVVFVPLEDGDRTEGLVKEGKTVITVDLNPLSRTAQKAHITIVDNIIRVMPLLYQYFMEMTEEEAQEILEGYDNQKIIARSLETISSFWKNKLAVQ